MAKTLGLGHQEFLERFAQRHGAGWVLKEVPEPDGEGFDCVLLARDPDTGLTRCTVHRERPTQCRTWPFWPENLKSPRAWRQAGSECEGIGQGPHVGYREIVLNRDATPEPGTAYEEPEEEDES